jgi:hypothetical protein
LILGKHPALRNLAVLEPIQAVCTPFQHLPLPGSSSGPNDEPVFVVCQDIVDRDLKRVVS